MTASADPRSLLAPLGQAIAEGRLIPFLGPDLLETGEAECPVPTSTRGLVERLTARVGVPGRIRGNLWASAQYIETYRHRTTLVKLMTEIFKQTPPVGPLQRWLAGLPGLPLIVDSWYDATLSEAFKDRNDWGQVQAASRHGLAEVVFLRAISAAGVEVPLDAAAAWKTLIYKPHGAIWPLADMLVSDSDYVEALTEIDIQTPIPVAVQEIRATRGFLFLGCRFHDQMLRIYARQILKRSAGPHYALLPEDLTRNELRFLDELSITPLFLDLETAIPLLTGGDGGG
ncbi:SIR2 family NAD-dependent protein deacylase [Rhodospirillum rubrum]|uniref:Uncharacterized protein n=2 Tax=Rhodospirillum rubrum TaxID=1085 RepID=Q2RVP5_RHORT|nr:SIR2 family protein [Rhodospirillum rubrum]ABC21800.1 conserved hypothetical protein [Rhodospirillum rubrum ATCC 11170]AEO47500.1 hypothetical protein F11_05150 [Rhodospirillum rubrum F11]MBK5953357.1 SIR2 family protein [Rhodospirillum rubrum]QXG81464.1 SIR2 family protein [Rhodospirillum rubrum]